MKSALSKVGTEAVASLRGARCALTRRAKSALPPTMFSMVHRQPNTSQKMPGQSASRHG